MIATKLDALATAWTAAKEAERVAVENRRELEDQMRELVGFAETTEGTSTTDAGQYRVKITGRIDRKVDAELVQELAAENGLSEHLGALFRWKPELNLSAWKSADESITRALSGAITAKPGRPSFSITIKE